MTILEKWQRAQTEMDKDGMENCLHDDFKFMNYSQSKEFTKRDIINWILSGDIHRDRIRILYENSEVAVEHSYVSFKDGNRQAVLGFYTIRDDKLYTAETGATNVDQ